VLQAAGNSGTKVIEPRIEYQTWWSQYPKARNLGRIRAWHIDGGSVRFDLEAVHSRLPNRVVTRSYAGHRYLGVDGTKYQVRSHGLWEAVPLAEIDEDDDFPGMAISYLRRLAREVAPSLATTERVELFGSSFQVAPKKAPRGVTGKLQQDCPSDIFIPYVDPISSYKKEQWVPGIHSYWLRNATTLISLTAEQAHAFEEELRCEDPSAGVSAPRRSPRIPSSMPTRELQIRYAFMSWLCLITLTGYGSLSAHPTMFLKPSPPYARGGPISEEELAGLTAHLMDSGLAEWADSYSVRMPPYHLVLTERGVRKATELHSAYASPARTRRLLTAVMKWAGQHAKAPHTVAIQSFLSAPDCEFEEMIASATETYRATRWLVNRGYLYRSQNFLPTTDTEPVLVSVTREGLMCLDGYDGDPMAMREAQRRGEDRRSFHFGPNNAVAFDSKEFTQTVGDPSSHSTDVSDLVRFAQAVLQALPVLDLEPGRHRAAELAVSEIITTADDREPDHPKLTTLGHSLRAILEGTATNVVTAVLLGIWKG
jgi:hypothetical protein